MNKAILTLSLTEILLTIVLNNFHDNLLKNAFENKKPLVATRQAKYLRNLFIRAQIDVFLKPIAPPKNIGLNIATIILTLAKN